MRTRQNKLLPARGRGPRWRPKPRRWKLAEIHAADFKSRGADLDLYFGCGGFWWIYRKILMAKFPNSAWLISKSASFKTRDTEFGEFSFSWLGSPSWLPLPHSYKFLFCLVLISYMRSGCFSWCKLFLLIYFCTLTLCNNPGYSLLHSKKN